MPPVCPRCPNRSFKNAAAVRQHRESKHSDGYSCEDCNRVFRSQQALDQHTTDKHSSFECNYCNREFATDNGRLAHEKAKHSSMFECEYCDREFTTDEGRLAHEKAKHPPMFECHHCDSEFTTAQGRDAHEEAVHTFECRYCDREFNSEEARRQHEDAKHHTFECYYCDHEFSSDTARQQHHDSKHTCTRQSFAGYATSTQWKCTYCPLEFCTQASRTAHEASCSRNPATLTKQPASTLSDSSSSQLGLQSFGSPRPMGTIEDDLSSSVSQSTDEESVLSGSHSSSDEEEMFRSTSGIAPTDTASEAPTAGQPSVCPHLLEPGTCSMCFQASNTEKPIEIDVANVPPSDDGRQGYTMAHHDVIFRCTICLDIFETEAALQGHNCSFYTTIIRPHCPICYSQFDDESLLKQHLEGRELFSCQLCLTRCCSDEMMQDHVLGHPTCGKCSKSFVDDLALCAHVESDHPVVVCWDCDGIVVEKNSLELHYADSPAHPSCAFCGLGKRNTAEMDEHVKDAHPASAETKEHPEGDNTSHGEESLLAEEQPPSASRGDVAQPLAGLGCVPPSDMEVDGGPVDEPHHDGPLQRGFPPASSTQPMPPGLEIADEVTTNVSIINAEEPPDDGLRQCASPSPTPSEHGSNFSRVQPHTPTVTNTAINNTRPPSPASTVSAEAFSVSSTQSTSTTSSHSVVFVSADGIPDYIRENRAILVATSLGSHSSGRTSLRLPSWSSIESLEMAGRVQGGRVPASDPTARPSPPTGNVTHRLHCRICLRDPCEDMTATICGHVFCKRCITQAVVAKSECPVCKSATLLYCLFKLDLSA